MATSQTESQTAVLANLWQFWAGTLVAVVAAMYFMTHNHLIKYEGEWFYALVFFVAAAVLLGYGGYQYFDATRKL